MFSAEVTPQGADDGSTGAAVSQVDTQHPRPPESPWTCPLLVSPLTECQPTRHEKPTSVFLGFSKHLLGPSGFFWKSAHVLQGQMTGASNSSTFLSVQRVTV